MKIKEENLKAASPVAFIMMKLLKLMTYPKRFNAISKTK